MQAEEKEFVIAYHLGLLLMCGLGLGLLTGVVISVRAGGIDEARMMADFFFNLLKLIVAGLLVFLVFKKREFWLGHLDADTSRTIGEVLGVALGGSLLASLFFWIFTGGIPYLMASFDATGFYGDLGLVFGYASQATLVGLAAVAALMTLSWAWWRRQSK